MTFASDYISNLIVPITKGEAVATCHWNERVANWDNPWARCQTWFTGLPDGRRQPQAVPENEMVYRAVRKDFFLESGGFNENEGRADDSSISKNTGILAGIVTDATCYHKNIGSTKELFADSLWHGRNFVPINKTFLRAVIMLFIYQNPIIHILRGLLLALKKREPRMVPYAVIHTAGFIIGTFHAISSGYYLK